MAERTTELDNNFTVLYEDGLDGGGIDHLPDFKTAVESSGQSHYTRAVEWCAGFGVIGFDFLNRGVCDHISFIECHEPAIHWLSETSKQNSVEDKTSLYLTDKIATIPNDVKWDLLLANPPHCFTLDIKEMFEKTVENPSQCADVIRLTCDVDFIIHKEFFENIREHLLPNADLFISEVGDLEEIKQLAINAGLIWAATHPAPKLSINSKTDAVVFHFKEPM